MSEAMQFYYDPDNNDKQYAFNPDVVVTANPAGGFSFKSAVGAGLGPYPSTLIAGLAPVIPPPAPTLAQQAADALNAPYTITSASLGLTSVPFAIDAITQAHIGAEINAILLNGVFADGTATVAWPDATVAQAVHILTISQFKFFASLLGAYVAALYKVQNGTLTTLPAASISTQ